MNCQVFIMDKPLNQNDFNNLKMELQNAIENDEKYWRVNQVKCDAIHTARTYEEFSDRVAAAHLHPIEKSDKININKYNTIWNLYAQKQINEHK